MRWMLWLVIAAGCEKSGPVETSGGPSSAPREPTAPVASQPAPVATLPTDAGVAVVVDAAAVAVAPDAAAPRRPRPTGPSMSDEDAMAIANLLVMEGSSNMNKRRPGADLGKQIADVRDSGGSVRVGAGGSGRGPRGDGDPRVGNGSATPVDSPDSKTPPGRISVKSKTAVDHSSLDADMVVRKIEAVYMAGLKRCYRTHLKQNATAKGEVKLSLTVQEGGRVVVPRAAAFATEIGDCMGALLPSWRFPIPKDNDGEPMRAAFEIVLELTPE
jgi:hypothetical protein